MKLGDSINTQSLGHEAPCRANPLGQAQEGQPMTIEKLIYATLWLAVSPAIARWFVGTPALGSWLPGCGASGLRGSLLGRTSVIGEAGHGGGYTGCQRDVRAHAPQS